MVAGKCARILTVPRSTPSTGIGRRGACRRWPSAFQNITFPLIGISSRPDEPASGHGGRGGACPRTHPSTPTSQHTPWSRIKPEGSPLSELFDYLRKQLPRLGCSDNFAIQPAYSAMSLSEVDGGNLKSLA